MEQLNRVVLKEFSKKIDLSSFHNAYNLITHHLKTTLSTIKKRNPYITDYNIYVANEVFCGTEYFSSGLDLFVVFNALQIELNYNNKPKSKLKKNIRYFWKEFVSHFNIFSSKKKKNEKFVKSTEKKVLSLKEYDVEVLLNDIFVNLSKTLYNKTSIQTYGNKITIIGEEEFGMDINIYPVFITQNDLYKMYNVFSQKNVIIDFKNRFDNVAIKNEKTDNQFTTQIRAFNNLYWNVLKKKPNQIFIESMLFSCPDNLFEGDSTTVTINLINYIKNSSIQNMHSICDENVKIFNDKLNTTNLDLALKFINNINIV